MDLSVLSKLIDGDKIGGWVRAGVASLLTILISKIPALSAILDPGTQAAIAVAISGIVVGIWSTMTKSDGAKIAAVAALPDVQKVVVKANAADGVGAALADPAQPKVVAAT